MQKYRLNSNPLALTFAVSLVAALSAHAQLYDYEGFDYSGQTTIAGQSGGTGWGGNWSTGGGPTLATPGPNSLQYTDSHGNVLSTTGGDVEEASATSTTINPQRTVGLSGSATTFGSLASGNGGTLWMSYLWQSPNTSSAGVRQASLGLYQGSSEYLDLGTPNIATTGSSVANNFSLWGSGKGNMGSTPNSTAPIASSIVNDGSTMFVLMEMIIDSTTASDTLYVWVNPLLDATPDTSDATFTFTGQDLTGINNIRLSANGLNATYGTVGGEQNADELRLGASFADVTPMAVPEPSTLALAGASGLALLASLKRKRQ